MTHQIMHEAGQELKFLLKLTAACYQYGEWCASVKIHKNPLDTKLKQVKLLALTRYRLRLE
jgi:hypothetical protein